MFCICGLYYMCKNVLGKEMYYGVQQFLGVKGEYRIFIYEDEPTENTLMFDSREEALVYLKNHKSLNNGICVESHFVLELHDND